MPERYFLFEHNPGDPFTVSELIAYLQRYDDKFGSTGLFHLIKDGQKIFDDVSAESIKLLTAPGTDIFKGQKKDALLSDGLKALNRIGYYKIVGNVKKVELFDLKGQMIPSYQAPVMFRENLTEEPLVGVMNVGTLFNDEGFGFNLRSQNELDTYHQQFNNVGKLEFLNSLAGKVFYVTDQFSVKSLQFDNKIKHTIWVLLPASLFFLTDYISDLIPKSENIRFNRED